MKEIATIIASGFGTGFIKPGPGTWGTLSAFVILGLCLFIGVATKTLLIIFLLSFTFGGYLAINHLPNTWSHDDQRIVVDEIAGYFMTLLWLPLNWVNLLLAFVLFRFYDILKPFGIRRFDNLKDNRSVMVDDLLAGVYANLTLRLILVVLAWI